MRPEAPDVAGASPVGAALEPRLRSGIIALAASAVAGLLTGGIAARLGGVPERYVPVVAAAVALSVGLGAALLFLFWTRDPGRLAIGLVAIVSVWLCGMLACLLAPKIRFRADILFWAESQFVHDLLKLRVGYPLYTTQLNNESFIYMPGAQLLTYAIARPLGLDDSIPFLRLVQVGFLVLASVAAFAACRDLVRDAAARTAGVSSLWGFVWLPVLLLATMNPFTNTYAVGMHNDALACLVSVLGFLLLVRISRDPSWANLVALALIPVLGFSVKQSLAIWAMLAAAYLLFFAPSRSWKRAFVFAAAAFGGILAIVGLGLALWREPFWYWVFVVPGTRGVSIMRSTLHVLDAWPFFVAGLVGGALVLLDAAPERVRAVFGLWVAWLVFMCTEAYTSGIGWTLHHMGPGSVIAVIWLLAGVAIWWGRSASAQDNPWRSWTRYGVQAATLLLLMNGLGMVRLPLPMFGEDHERYLRAIEAEFVGVDPKRTLLDEGTWVYLPSRTIAMDRLIVIGDRGYAMSGDFSGMIRRLDEKYYSKMLFRNLDADRFGYDHEIWPESSGIRAAILRNYEEIGRIPGVMDSEEYAMSEISIMVPRRGDGGTRAPSPVRP